MRVTVPDGHEPIGVDANSTGISLLAEDSAGNRWRAFVSPGDDISSLSADVRAEIQALMTPERVAAYEASQIPIPDIPEGSGVPQAVTPYQARQALNAAGLRDAVEAAVAAASHEVRDAWEYALAIERHSTFVVAIGSALDLTESEIDDLFIAAGGM